MVTPLTTVLITYNRPGTELGCSSYLRFIWRATFPCAESRRQPPPHGPLWVYKTCFYRANQRNLIRNTGWPWWFGSTLRWLWFYLFLCLPNVFSNGQTGGTPERKSTKYSLKPPWSPCTTEVQFAALIPCKYVSYLAGCPLWQLWGARENSAWPRRAGSTFRWPAAECWCLGCRQKTRIRYPWLAN